MVDLTFSHGGNIYEVKRKFGKDVVDFSANINPLGLTCRIKEVIHNNIESILHYPDPEAKDAIKSIAAYWGIKEDNILISNGSIELIYLIISTFRPKTVLIAIPTFSEYERAARTAKSKIDFLKLEEKEGFNIDLSLVRDSDIFFLCNPNNPSGNIILNDRSRVKSLPNKLIVVDETFMDFLPDEEAYTMAWKACGSRKIIVLRTFTKFFALAGLRIGYLIGHKGIIQMLKQYQAPWNVNSLAQIAAGSVLNDVTYIHKTRSLIKRERDFLSIGFAKIDGLKPFPSEVNFILVKIEKKGIDSHFLSERLLQKGVMIRDCSNFRNLNKKFIRVAVRKRSENAGLLKLLKEIFK